MRTKDALKEPEWGFPKIAIKLALAKHRDLTPAGFGGGKHGDFDHRQIETALAFLELCGSAPVPTYGSYTLKHVCEDWGAIFSRTPYIANGAIIVAAIALGLVVVRFPERGCPNGAIGVDQRKTVRIMRALRWCGDVVA